MINTRLLNSLLWLLSLLPLRVLHLLGKVLGWLFWQIPNRQRKITRINLALCYPNKSELQRFEIGRKSLQETGKTLCETAAIWNWNQRRLNALVKNTVNPEVFDKAVQRGKGVILASPHLGAWELIPMSIGAHYPMTNMYRPPRASVIEPIIIRARERFGAKTAPVTPSGIRQILKALKKQEVIGILPDQEPDRESGVFVPLFNVQTCTMTLLGKLASKSKASVVFCVMKRLSNGYELHYLEPDKDIYNENPASSAAAVNRAIENCIAIAPEQYIWSYRRFRLLEEHGTRKYS